MIVVDSTSVDPSLETVHAAVVVTVTVDGAGGAAAEFEAVLVAVPLTVAVFVVG